MEFDYFRYGPQTHNNKFLLYVFETLCALQHATPKAEGVP